MSFSERIKNMLVLASLGLNLPSIDSSQQLQFQLFERGDGGKEETKDCPYGFGKVPRPKEVMEIVNKQFKEYRRVNLVIDYGGAIPPKTICLRNKIK